MPTNTLTTHRAASLERQAWIAKLKREYNKLWADDASPTEVLTIFERYILWGMDRVRRFEKKKGGLGK